MNFHVVTLFPETVEAYTNASILGRAQKEKRLKVKTYQLRDFAGNKWGKVDERPYGGGPGMVLRAEPFIRAVQKIRKAKPNAKVLITAAGGKLFTNAYARKLSREKDVIILCGRYEGIDARVKKILKAEDFSVGPYILTGGEVPALTIIDATARQISGVLGKLGSLEEGRVASHDVYTRPETITHKGKTYRTPKVLLSGHHANIDMLRDKKRSS
jgi:tRNA (guanine37-N1)-methyltransferase